MLWVLPPLLSLWFWSTITLFFLSLIFSLCHFSWFLISSPPISAILHFCNCLCKFSLPGPSSPFRSLCPPKDADMCCLGCYLDHGHPCCPSVCMQPRVHHVVLPKPLLTACSSFLVEFNLLVIGLLGLCEVFDWLLQLLLSFRELSNSTIKPTLLPVPIGRKGVPIIQ